MQKLSKEEWRIAIAECRQSGIPVRGWCAERELSHKAFYYWEKRLRDNKESSTALPAKEWVSINQMSNTKMDIPSSGNKLTLRLADICIDVRPGISHSLLAEVIKTLRDLC